MSNGGELVKVDDESTLVVARRLYALVVKFVHQVDGLAEAFPGIVSLLNENSKRAATAFVTFRDKCAIKSPGSADNTFVIPPEKYSQFKIIDRRRRKDLSAKRSIPPSLFVALVSNFDAFLGDLLRAIFETKAELLGSSEKNFTFSQILELGSVEEIRRTLIEKEVESVLRESHSEHFAWMERRFGLPLTKGLESWPNFIEITERRNLFVHADGIVSSQYLAVCRKHGATKEVEGLKKGDVLEVSTEYFNAAYACILEIGVKLAHVLWRKIFPETRHHADGSFNDLCFNLIVDEKWDLSILLLEFACNTFREFSTESMRRYMILNLAQSYKWAGKNERCAKLLDGEDWSACSDSLRIAERALREDYDEVAALIQICSQGDKIGKAELRDWPIFREVRQSSLIQKKFSEIYGEPLLEVEVVTDECDRQAPVRLSLDSPKSR